MNNNGFTLVELIVSIAILGLISAMSVPTLNAVQSQMEEKQFVSYGDALVSAAKLYTDSNYEDMFASGNTAQITYKDMNDKGLVKDIGVDNVTCNTNGTYIVVVKRGSSYVYCLNMECKNSAGTATAYSNSNSEFGSSTGVCQGVKSYNVKYRCDKYDDIKQTVPVLAGQDYTVDFSVCSKTGKKLSSYSYDSSTVYSSSPTITVKKDITLTANYDTIQYTLNYHTDHGSCSPTSKSVNYGSTWGDLCEPTANGYDFEGWYKKDTTTKITNTTKATESIDVEAIWSRNSSPNVVVKVYKSTSDGNKTGLALKQFDSNGADTLTINSADIPGNTNGWYNKTNFPYGLYYEFITSDDEIASVQEKYNDSNLTTNFEKLTHTDKLITNPGSTTGFSLRNEGKRYATYTIVGKNNKITTIKIYANIDRTAPTISNISYQTRANVSSGEGCQLVPNNAGCDFTNYSSSAPVNKSNCNNIDYSNDNYCRTLYGTQWTSKTSTSNVLSVYGPSSTKSYIKINSITLNDALSSGPSVTSGFNSSTGLQETVSSSSVEKDVNITVTDNAGNSNNLIIKLYYTGAGGGDAWYDGRAAVYQWKFIGPDTTNYVAKTGWAGRLWVRLHSASSINKSFFGYWYYSDSTYKLVSTTNYNNSLSVAYRKYVNGRRVTFYDACSSKTFMGSKQGCQLAGWYKMNGKYYYFWTGEENGSGITSANYAWGQNIRGRSAYLYADSQAYYNSTYAETTSRYTYYFDSSGACTNCSGSHRPVTRNNQ